MSKRQQFAQALQTTGILRALEWLRAKPGILVINHHRIGDPEQSRFDRAVFSATADQLHEQIVYLKRHAPIISGEELEQLATGQKPLKRLYIAITFDDGYLDNYTNALEVLRDHRCGGTFFLVPEYVGASLIPWWDAIAFMVRNSAKSSITLNTPAPLTVTLGEDREPSIYAVLQHYKRADNLDADTFMSQLQTETDCPLPETGRRFLNWSEALEMQESGMTIGSHTLTHRILGQLSHDEQRVELETSKSILEQQLGTTISTLAYPVGSRTAFSSKTEAIARSLGYKLCFSFYGGFNLPGALNPTNLLRTTASTEPLMLRNETTLLTRFGKMPY